MIVSSLKKRGGEREKLFPNSLGLGDYPVRNSTLNQGLFKYLLDP